MIDKELRKQLATMKTKPGRPRLTDTPTTPDGTAIDEQRATYILKRASVRELKKIAKLTNRKIKEVAQEAIDNFIKQHHNDNK